MSTLAEPCTMTPGPAGTHGTSEQGVVWSVTLAAGTPSIRTVMSPVTMASGTAGWGTAWAPVPQDG